MIKKTREELTLITPEMANNYLKFNTYVTQRKIRPAHVTELVSKMESGLFRFGEIAIAHAKHSNTFMLNGQHVCTAIIKSNTSQRCVVEEYRIDNDTDMSILFRQFEILTRTITDMVNVEKHSLGLDDWPLWLAGIVVSAGAIMKHGDSQLRCSKSVSSTERSMAISKDDRVNLLSQFIPEGNFLKKILVSSLVDTDINHMKRSAVAVMMMLTWRKSNDDAESFWLGVRDGEYLSKMDPEMQLREFLKSTKTISFRNQFTYRKASNHEIGFRSALAWNAFRRGNKISKTSYFPDKPIPKII